MCNIYFCKFLSFVIDSIQYICVGCYIGFIYTSINNNIKILRHIYEQTKRYSMFTVFFDFFFYGFGKKIRTFSSLLGCPFFMSLRVPMSKWFPRCSNKKRSTGSRTVWLRVTIFYSISTRTNILTSYTYTL